MLDCRTSRHVMYGRLHGKTIILLPDNEMSMPRPPHLEMGVVVSFSEVFDRPATIEGAQEQPLIGRIRAKAKKTYITAGERIDLLLYYERQFPFAPAECLKEYEADIASALIPNGPFSLIWIFHIWTNEIIWKREAQL